MSKRQLLMILGVWVMILLFLGFPSSWDKIIALVTGACIVAIAYALRREKAALTETKEATYVEHTSTPAPLPNIESPITSDNTQTS